MSDLEFMREQWMKLAKSNEEYHLYLHIPFCVKHCKYCVYTGNLVTAPNYSKLKNDYLKEYLPAAIKTYGDVFKTKPPNSFYLGGGTPNLMCKDELENIFNSIPNFKNIKYKVADLNPCYMNLDLIDLFKKYNFTTLCFGVQSFDVETLEKNNRDYISPERMNEILSKCYDCGIYTSMDIMAFLNHYNMKDLDILNRDVETALTLNVDFVSVNPNLHFIINNEEYIRAFEGTMDRIMSYVDGTYTSEKNISNASLNNRYIYRIVSNRIKDKFYSEVLTYFADDFPYATQNIIGIGDLNNPHSTMSYIKNNLFYVEKNVNNKPVYEIRYVKHVSKSVRTLKEMLAKY